MPPTGISSSAGKPLFFDETNRELTLSNAGRSPPLRPPLTALHVIESSRCRPTLFQLLRIHLDPGVPGLSCLAILGANQVPPTSLDIYCVCVPSLSPLLLEVGILKLQQI